MSKKLRFSEWMNEEPNKDDFNAYKKKDGKRRDDKKKRIQNARKQKNKRRSFFGGI